MNPRASTRPIRRATPPREPAVPPEVRRVLDAFKPWRHLMKAGSCEILAISQWADLQVLDRQRLALEIQARILKPESRKYLVGPVRLADRLAAEDEAADDRHGGRYGALWRPPTEAPAGPG